MQIFGRPLRRAARLLRAQLPQAAPAEPEVQAPSSSVEPADPEYRSQKGELARNAARGRERRG